MTLLTCSTIRPSVWIGCLTCYNGGDLVGQWFPAEDAEWVTPNDLHDTPTPHEELWCFDHEGFPKGTGEISPHTASLWGELYNEVGEEQWPALLAWVGNGSYVVDADNLPNLPSFEDTYQGEWDSFDDYATQLAEDIGLTDGWPDEAQRYFDWEAWTRDLKYDYDVVEAPHGGVFIFRC